MTPSNNKKRIQVLWRSTPDSPLEWRVVHATRRRIPHLKDAPIYSYRRGPAVFIAHEKTGLNLSYGSTVTRALAAFNFCTKEMDLVKFNAMLDLALTKLTVPEKPSL